jgi:hypothetical protein
MRFGRQLLVAALALPALVAPAVAEDRSGPKVGSGISAFDVQDITGPNKGKTLCYV